MRWVKALGLARVLGGVAATGVVVARAERRRQAYTPDEVRTRLRERYAEVAGADPAGAAAFGAEPFGSDLGDADLGDPDLRGADLADDADEHGDDHGIGRKAPRFLARLVKRLRRP